MVKKEQNKKPNVQVLSKKKINRSFSDNALKMLKKRYLYQYDNGRQETPADMFERVARGLAEVEKDYGRNERFVRRIERDFFDILSRKEFTPAGRTMTNIGTDMSLIANCIVLPIEDSMDGIFQTLKEASLLQQAGSGLGFALDNLRPALSPTIRSRGVASGPVSFLKVYNEAFGTIKQQGRHGANMAMISVDHPDVLDFVRSKMVEGEVANFNISVKVTDEFMDKLKNNPESRWYCSWKGEKVKPRRVLRHPNGSVYDVEELDISVGELFGEIVKYAWTNGEPGIVFIDTVNKTNPLPSLGNIPSSNPCGEQFLHPYDNCNLGSINLAQFAKNGQIDFKRLRYVTKTAVRMLDNVVDRFDFPVEEINEMARKNRRIGLGIMGFADMLYQLRIKYNSEEGFDTAHKVMSTIQKAAEEMSEKLAKEKAPFPNYKLSIFKDGSRRNAALTTVAPTGSISMMFDTSSGIEPNFALFYVKQDKDGEQYSYLTSYVEDALKEAGLDEEELEKVRKEVSKKGSIQHLDNLPESIKDTFVVSMDVPGDDHIRMQAAFQEHVDNSISKTINMRNEATTDDVKNSFILAWELGCKSCTVYRDGSREVQILNVGEGKSIIAPTQIGRKKLKESTGHGPVVDNKLSPRKRPEVMQGVTYKMKTGYGNIYITVNDDENGEPFEVFATIGKTGGFFQEQSEAICRLISLALRAGIKADNVVKNLKGIRGPMPIITDKGTILSLPDAIARVLEDHISPESDEEEDYESEETGGGVRAELLEIANVKREVELASFSSSSDKEIADYGVMPGCPECGAPLQIGEGCMSCRNCGYSRCG